MIRPTAGSEAARVAIIRREVRAITARARDRAWLALDAIPLVSAGTAGACAKRVEDEVYRRLCEENGIESAE